MRPLPAPVHSPAATRSAAAAADATAAAHAAGWAIAGVCPGPALVAALGSPSTQSLTIAGAMVSGMLLHKHLEPLYARLLGTAQSQAAVLEAAEQAAAQAGQAGKHSM